MVYLGLPPSGQALFQDIRVEVGWKDSFLYGNVSNNMLAFLCGVYYNVKKDIREG